MINSFQFSLTGSWQYVIHGWGGNNPIRSNWLTIPTVWHLSLLGELRKYTSYKYFLYICLYDNRMTFPCKFVVIVPLKMSGWNFTSWRFWILYQFKDPFIFIFSSVEAYFCFKKSVSIYKKIKSHCEKYSCIQEMWSHYCEK